MSKYFCVYFLWVQLLASDISNSVDIYTFIISFKSTIGCV